MNQFLFILLFTLVSITNNFSQIHNVFLNYQSNVPFQTYNESENYNLQSTLLIRKIISDIVSVVDKKVNTNHEIEFVIIIKNKKGAVLPINYLVEPTPYSSQSSKDIFLKRTYNWINRTFRSNIPYEDG